MNKIAVYSIAGLSFLLLLFTSYHYYDKCSTLQVENKRLEKELALTVEKADKYKETTDKLLNSYDSTIKKYEDTISNYTNECDKRIAKLKKAWENQEPLNDTLVINEKTSQETISDINKKIKEIMEKK